MTIIDDAATPRDARQALLLRRAKLAGEIEAGVATRSTKEGGNVMDSAELAADNVARDVLIAEIDRDAGEMAAIDAALARLDAGTYGQCVDCGAAIDAARLERVPETARCTPCQRRREASIGARIARL